MSYQLNKTDGTILTDLIDGQIDTESTNLILVGRNYTGYGEAFNENFIKLLENFANTAAPSNPLTGQVWWDTQERRLKVFDGDQWKASGGPFVSSTQPQMVAGDLWINNSTNQIFAFDGSDLFLIGPQYTTGQGTSGFQIADITDVQSRNRTVAELWIGGSRVGIFSDVTFTPLYEQRILELVTDSNPNGIIYKGFNILDKDTFKIYGTAESANALVTGAGVERTADQFLPSDSNGITVGTLTIQNSGGLTIGLSQNNVQKVIGDRFYIENQLRDHDLSLRVRSSAFESVIVDAIYIDAEQARVGIFNRAPTGEARLPEYTLDVQGDLRVTGNLLVEGTQTTFEVETLRVLDKIIEIGITDDSTELNDVGADASGISVNSTDGSKDLIWLNATNSFTSNVNLDLLNNNLTYKINGVNKVLHDRLDESIRFADGIERLGTLVNLDIDNININGTTIKSGALVSLGDPGNNPLPLNIIGTNGINITANGNIAIQDNQKITGLAYPTDDQDAASKKYVDDEILFAPIVFSMDITGLGTGLTLQSNVSAYLNDLFPANPGNIGKTARIHTTSYAGATVSGIEVTVSEFPDASGVLQISRIAVDSAGTRNESVIQDIVQSADASGTAVLSPARQIMIFESNGASWDHISTTAYP